MKWINHMAIAGATTAVFAPELVPVALLGSTAPDWMEWVLKALRKPVKHRTVTHYVSAWAVGLLFAIGLWDFNGLLAAFFWGGLSHVLADSLTVMGVPFSPHSDRRFHLFGGRLRTGDVGEYFIAWGLVVVCFGVSQMVHTEASWYPFFFDWGGYYEQGVIDGHEWKQNRFRFF